MTPRLTVGITTRDRAESLNRCLGSLEVLRSLSPEIVVFDDGSNPPAQQAIATHTRVRVLRDDRRPGYIVGRNRMVREAAAPDAGFVIGADASHAAVERLFCRVGNAHVEAIIGEAHCDAMIVVRLDRSAMQT